MCKVANKGRAYRPRHKWQSHKSQISAKTRYILLFVLDMADEFIPDPSYFKNFDPLVTVGLYFTFSRYRESQTI